ncbi:hypothetical protein HYPSUDRAFT_134909, partial [Hypholoma sublateritium FD-334 SS-4]
DLWENQPAAEGTNWKVFKDKIYKLYPGSQSERKYNIVNLKAMTDKQMRMPIESAVQFGEYYHDFTQISHYLKKQGQLNNTAISDKFIGGVDPAFHHHLRLQLHAEDPLHYPDDAYKLTQVAAVCMYKAG